jgi:AraC family transcriptional regulator of adaptative response/methylated-DNA-[protein]-cysteine methyltransferase
MPALEQTLRHLEDPRITLDLPLDLTGSVFQRRVWDALRQIPLGETASYLDIARQLGQPKAFRAVANACGANPLAVIVPCHRVLRQDGSLGGYRWGLERKRQLLDREAQR